MLNKANLTKKHIKIVCLGMKYSINRIKYTFHNSKMFNKSLKKKYKRLLINIICKNANKIIE